MATDVEESDTDDRERPGPAKRQRVAPRGGQQPGSSNDQQLPQESNDQEEIVDEEEEDKKAREKLRSWQACQVAKGFVDNAINRVVESYKMFPTLSYHFEDPWFCLFRGNQMEDTAVSMAIRNHGLVRSLDLIESPSLVGLGLASAAQCSVNMQASVSASSSETLLLTDSETARFGNEVAYLDDIYDSDHQQDFLDRAVAEAIKKKGLSTLSVDYG